MKSHSDKNTKQPKLRFPGFTGEWEEKRLGDVAEITGGGTPDTKKRNIGTDTSIGSRLQK
jgi:restriction endonuclease S subunit